MKEKQVFVYYLEIKNTANKNFLSNNEIRTAFDEISTFEWSRGQTNSMLRELGGSWYALDVETDDSNNLKIMGNRVRDEDLPSARFSKERVEQLQPPNGADVVERSYGMIYFPTELSRGCFVFLLKNRHGISISALQNYIKEVFPRYNPIKTTISKSINMVEVFSGVQELRYLILNNKQVTPAPREGVGDYHDRATHQDEPASIYNIMNMKIDLREQVGDVNSVIRRIARDFTGKSRITDEDLRQFIADSNAHLTAVYHNERAQETTDLTKSLYAFDFVVRDNFIPERFYDFCNSKFNNNTIRAELIRLGRGISSNIHDNE